MHVYLIALAAVWGTAAGLLAPRTAYRLAVPAEEPWAAACPSGHPVRGWLGPARCRVPDCPSGRYGLGYGAAAGSAAVCGWLALTTGPHPELAVWLLLVPVGLVLARVDLLVFRLPDVLTLPALGGTAALLGVAALLPSHQGSWLRALCAAAAVGVVYLVLFLINPAGMGFGDVKLAPTVGLALGWYGWPTVFTGTFAGFALGALTGLVLIAARRANRRTPIPFGPFMLLGALAGVLY
ncbi:leader peptidase (prepilin peptidase) / N-methyltransferase [Streptomyces sp. DvalAA-14]|uniref:prepilin peptidase n=1 Tax=unclassified Streptomyces TaxID=2593676 RepID=UPI00081B3A20|nr:A24 family peptidase [Streptomyces sp. DvalAA-14]SCD54922.1 leader peptidase (prepilin peptidase) / N-methyltransferase [Streptomyces sp. DvalAA-14]